MLGHYEMFAIVIVGSALVVISYASYGLNAIRALRSGRLAESDAAPPVA